jgi:drug/metabolite transporter (DMT)-like permease
VRRYAGVSDVKWILVALIVLCTVLSDVLQSHEMKRHGEVDAFRVSGLKQTVRALFSRPLLLLSVVCLAVSFFAFLKLLAIAPLSFSVPITGSTYIADALLAKYILKERVNKQRWAGIVLITAGILLIAP